MTIPICRINSDRPRNKWSLEIVEDNRVLVEIPNKEGSVVGYSPVNAIHCIFYSVLFDPLSCIGAPLSRNLNHSSWNYEAHSCPLVFIVGLSNPAIRV